MPLTRTGAGHRCRKRRLRQCPSQDADPKNTTLLDLGQPPEVTQHKQPSDTMRVLTYKPGTRDCVVLAGTLHDPFTGRIIDFVRGDDTNNAVHIDHVVSVPVT